MGFSSPQQGPLQNISGQQQFTAAQAGGVANVLDQPIQTGTLPPGAQALVNQVLQANLANNRNTFSRLGLTGSTMEASAQNLAEEKSLADTFGIEEDMAKLGQQFLNTTVGALSGAAQTTQDIAANQTALDSALMGAIGNFGKAMGGAAGGPGAFSFDFVGA